MKFLRQIALASLFPFSESNPSSCSKILQTKCFVIITLNSCQYHQKSNVFLGITWNSPSFPSFHAPGQFPDFPLSFPDFAGKNCDSNTVLTKYTIYTTITCTNSTWAWTMSNIWKLRRICSIALNKSSCLFGILYLTCIDSERSAIITSRISQTNQLRVPVSRNI